MFEGAEHNKTATNKRAIVSRLGNPARDTFNVPYDLFFPLLIKLLITLGCYRHRGDIPQVLSAAWAQKKNTSRGTSHPPLSLSVVCLLFLAALLYFLSVLVLEICFKSHSSVFRLTEYASFSVNVMIKIKS